MNNFISFLGFLGLLVVAAACLVTIALILTGFWEIIKYITREIRGLKNENCSNRTQKTKIKR